jgi:hypothetical protein
MAKFRDLVQWDGKVDGMTYAIVGLVGLAIKHNIDRVLAGYLLASAGKHADRRLCL